jgi:hypothetical protein
VSPSAAARDPLAEPFLWPCRLGNHQTCVPASAQINAIVYVPLASMFNLLFIHKIFNAFSLVFRINSGYSPKHCKPADICNKNLLDVEREFFSVL